MSITGGRATRAVRHDYPYADGLTAETTKQEGHTSNLVPQGISGKKSAVPNRIRAGL